MTESTFSEAALVLMAHGTTEDADSAAAVYQHAATIRQQKKFLEVREACWKQEPTVSDVLAQLSSRLVFIVPFFFSAGYFAERVIPAALGFGNTRPQNSDWLKQDGVGRIWVYCEPVGTHVGLAEIIKHRAMETVQEFPFPRVPKLESVDLVIAAHGTEREANSRRSAEDNVRTIEALKLFGGVHALYLDEEPKISRWAELTTHRNVVVVPFFAGEGPHVKIDIPIQLGSPQRVVTERLKSGQSPWRNPTEVRGKKLWFTGAVGTHARMVEVILDRAQQRSHGPGEETRSNPA